MKEFQKEELLDFYETMMKIRKFDLEAVRARYNDEFLGYIHPYVGQEAIATAVCACLRRSDYIESNHRGHGHTIAKGADLKPMMAELYGKRTGYCKGKGGSMHIADFSCGMLGANGIVGGGFGLAVGAALASRVRKTDQIAVVFFGDGACNRGTFHEAANLAAAHHLPVIFVCENNGIACGTLHETGGQQSVTELARRAYGYDMESFIADGNNFFAVYDAMERLVYRARNKIGNRCGFLECKTHRALMHVNGDPQVYRDREAALERWHADDCIRRFMNDCINMEKITKEEFSAIDKKIDVMIEEARQFAVNSPYPDEEQLMEDLYD